MARRRRLPHDASSPIARRRIPGSDTDSAPGTRLKPRPLQRNAANARERARMRVLSRAFSRLKTSLPWVPEDTKLSKLDTLRLASGYIAHLRRVLLADDDQASSPGGPSEEACSPPRCLHPLALTWPFSFHQRLPSPVGEETENKVRNVASCRVYDDDASVTSHRVMKPQHHQHQQPPSCHGAHRYPSSADDGFDSFLDYLSSSSGPSQPPHSGRFLSVANHRPMCSS